ncbi:two-component sensor histidine kinase [Paenibacillus sp. FSL A5-0031]|uniref:sensor histidine kinase n=1 Tax=unclassified Paenibacillus TaxID=185978 RepID=UPI00096F13CC|nr:histidine kinase [Paenibacillus sp. FSL A5-0031]OME84968.1 two-component sensor histidine kinase [Paenibacillus sp. FSL A5-0031]
MPKINLFTKIVALIIIMLVPIMLLYFYSNKTSTDILGEELNKSNTNQLLFFQNQVNTSIDSMALWPDLLIQDPDISSLRDIFTEMPELSLGMITLIKRIQTKLAIQQNSSKWRSSLHIYSPILHRDISDNDVVLYDDADLKKRLKPGWQVKAAENNEFVFSRYAVTPYSSYLDPSSSNLVIEVQFDSSNIKDMLDKFKSDGRREPFYYLEGVGVIYNRSADKELTNNVIHLLKQQPLQDLESRTIDLGGEKYLVNIVKSETIGWHLIDYIPISEIIRPIQKTNQLFYVSLAGLLLLCCIAAYLLYAQVQVPIKHLIVGFQKLKNGDYSVRMKPRGRSEFGFLYTRFNLMVAQIQELFETVYLEKIHVREARLKQLQSQINPHFFYNCFSFISSMAKLEKNEAVVAMSHHLSNYYRYTTRQERDLVAMSEEINFVTSYLEIQKMRMPRLQYSISLPADMRHLEIPPLMLQPLVENAVIHGIEAWTDASIIQITGEWHEEGARLVVEDDGKGMSMEDILILQHKMQNQMDEQMGCGLWNVHQRMHLRFRGSAGVSFSSSNLGGLKVTITWSPS